MKTSFINTLLLSSILIGVSSTSSCQKTDFGPNNNATNSSALAANNMLAQIQNLPIEPINEAERNSLILMREEEKLARDIYLAMYNKWGANIFNNISSSEQTHMDAVLSILKKYQIADPIENNSPGEFQNTTLKNLYTVLLAKGSSSISEAYQVGATIEDLDISDLNKIKSDVDNQDILFVYGMLTKGSRNHLRSFYKNIQNSGNTYTPQYISKEEFDSIVGSPMETGY